MFQNVNFFVKKLILICLVFLLYKPIFCQEKSIETAGDIFLIAVPVVTFGSTLIKNDKKGSLQFAKGFFLNLGLTFILKNAINKERPNLENNNSFPSGHTSITFQSASFMQKRYGWKYGAPAYLVASFTAYSRLNAKKHDVVDVLAGAVIGIGSTYLFTTPYQQEHIELVFRSDKGAYMFGFKFKF